MSNISFESNILNPILTQIANRPECPAFFIEGKIYSYSTLGERISTIRQHIHRLASSENIEDADKPYAIAVHNDLDTYASILSLWMEGLSYVPLHPNQPLDRNLNIIHQIGTKHLLDSSTSSALASSCPPKIKIVCTSNLNYTEPFLDDWIQICDDKLAYILFTSGSTGTPKGVCITRRNIAAFIDSFWKTGITITENDHCLQAFDLTFDVSIQSFLTALIRGACLYTIPYGQVKYLQAASLIMEQGITFAAMAPSMLTYLRPYFDEIKAEKIRTCILTAEACPIDLIDDWYRCAENTEIYDFYGPTEATIYCTYYKLNRSGNNLSANGIISIGKPLANVTAIIIDENGEEATANNKGELCIAGAQVTPGYWNNPEKNSSAFLERERNGKRERFYHTGDLCYRDESGNIIYCGRIDQQAKIQGFRVELGEIEYHTRTFFHNESRSVAIKYTNPRGLDEIALFVESEPIDKKELIKYLESKMPQYMIPSTILFEPHFPINNSDKIDRVALRKAIKHSLENPTDK